MGFNGYTGQVKISLMRPLRAYFRKSGMSCRIRVAVEKNIPAGAGLGGGSSDAAAMLRLLNSRWSFTADEELHRMAVMLGADVPYCLFRRECNLRGYR